MYLHCIVLQYIPETPFRLFLFDFFCFHFAQLYMSWAFHLLFGVYLFSFLNLLLLGFSIVNYLYYLTSFKFTTYFSIDAGLGPNIAQVKFWTKIYKQLCELYVHFYNVQYMIKAYETCCCTYLHTKELDMVYLGDSWQPVWFPVCLSVCLCVCLSLTGENVFMLYLSPAWNQCIFIHPVGCPMAVGNLQAIENGGFKGQLNSYC